MNRAHRTFCLWSVAWLSVAVTKSSATEIDFYRDIFPILKANCISCHNKTTTKGDLNMESPELMKKGGESGAGLLAGKSAESLVWQAAAHVDPDLRMPPKNNKAGAVDLAPEEIALLKTWIDQGAKHSDRQARAIVWQPMPPGVNPIYAVALTRDGRYAACARANQIFIYDLATRQLVTQLVDQAGVAHRAPVQALDFSPDGTRLASGSFREVKIWKMDAGKVSSGLDAAITPPAPASEALVKQIAAAGKVEIVNSALSPDGERVVTGCADGVVRVWEVATAKLLVELRGSVTAGRQTAALEWAIGTQTLEQSFQNAEVGRIEAQNKAFDELVKKANETIVAMKKVLPEKEKLVKPAQDAKAAARLKLEAVAAQTAGATEGKPAEVLDKEQKEAHEILASTTMAETSALAALAAVESNIQDAVADVQRITAAQAQNLAELATARAAGETAKKALEKETGALATLKQTLAKNGAKPVAVTFSTDARKVSALLDDGSLQVWAVASGLPIEDVGHEKAAQSMILTPGPDGAYVATKATRFPINPQPNWKLERVLGGEKAGTAPFADRVNAVRFSPDGQTLAVGGGELSRSGDIGLFAAASGQPIATWAERHSDAVLSLSFSPDGRLLASGGADKMVRVTELASGRQVNLFEGHTHHVMGVAFRADGRALASAGGDGVVLVWDMILGERKKKIEGWTKEVTSLQYIGATAQLVTSAGDNLVRIVNDDGVEIRVMPRLPDFLQSAAATDNAGVVVGGGEAGQLRVWDGTNGKEIAVFGAK